MRGMADAFAVDLDGVIADTTAVKAAWISANLGLSLEPWQCDRSTCVPLIGEDAYRAMATALWEREATELVRPVAGVLEALALLARQGAVHVITARFPERLAYAERWLAAHGADRLVRSVISSAGTDKAARCAQVGARVLVDDDPRHLGDTNPHAPEGLLLKPGCRGAVPAVPAGATLCRSWSDVLAHLGTPGSWQAARPGRDFPGLRPGD